MKKIKTLLLIIICMFVFNIEVRAEIIECKYKRIDGNGEEQIKTMNIEYGDGNSDWMRCSFQDEASNKGKVFYPLQRLVLYDDENKKFTLDNQQLGYKIDGGNYTYSCPRKITIYEGTVNVLTDTYDSLDEEQQLVLFSKEGYSKDDGVDTVLYPNLEIDLDIELNNPVEYEFADSETISGGIVEGEEIECEYKKRQDSNTYNFKFEAVGDKGKFYRSDEWIDIYSNVSSNISDCPKALHYDDARREYYFTEPTLCDEDDKCYFRSLDSEYYLNQTTYAYILYNASSNAKINVKVSNEINSDDKSIKIYKDSITITDIIVSNLDKYSESFKSESISETPKYLYKEKGGEDYFFTDTKPDNYDELYMGPRAFGFTGVGEETIYKTCRELFGDTFFEFLNEYVFKVIWIGIPILLILFTTFDFAKVVFIDDKDGINKAWKNFLRRAIVAVLIILTPTIIIILSNIIGVESVDSCAKTLRSMSNQVGE